LNLQIGTIDEEGDPNIQPVWFYYDKDREKLLIITPKVTKKGVKGKGIPLLLLDLSNHGLLVHLVMVAVQSLLPQNFKQINNSYLLVKMNNRNPYTCRELVPSQAFYNSVF
jgi:hypothetical protein